MSISDPEVDQAEATSFFRALHMVLLIVVLPTQESSCGSFSKVGARLVLRERGGLEGNEKGWKGVPSVGMGRVSGRNKKALPSRTKK